ncbi:MAG: AAC(3) family N-acetyltransferase [Clostridia bacterium]|nr:AAC(3) family N-acetyltransferase [Clostridia bacterium]
MNNSFKTICDGLYNLGLKKGDTVFVHSSLKSMGNVEGGAITVIDALKEVVGESGTVLFPAFSFSVCSSKYFSYNDTPSCVGFISETFRKLDGVVRSMHPTHSASAYGKNAVELTKDHYLDDTPVGANSPLRKLPKLGGKILMLGCPFASNTFMHGMEEVANAPYALKDVADEYTLEDKNGNKTKKLIRGHYFVRPEGNIIQHYERALNVLELNKDYFLGDVHGAKCALIDTVALQEKAVQKMKEEPLYFVDDPSGILK